MEEGAHGPTRVSLVSPQAGRGSASEGRSREVTWGWALERHQAEMKKGSSENKRR